MKIRAILKKSFIATISLSLISSPTLAQQSSSSQKLSINNTFSERSKQIGNILTQSKNGTEFMEKLKPFIDEESLTFLKEKFKGRESVAFYIENYSENNYTFKTENKLVSFSFKELQPNGRVLATVNNHNLDFNADTTLEEMILKVQGALPKTVSFRGLLFQEMIPSADAAPGIFTLAALVLGGGYYFMQRGEPCAKLKDLGDQCSQQKNVSKPQVLNMIERLYANSALITTCPSVNQKAVTCVRNKANKTGVRVKDVPERMRLIMDMPAIDDSDLSRASKKSFR